MVKARPVRRSLFFGGGGKKSLQSRRRRKSAEPIFLISAAAYVKIFFGGGGDFGAKIGAQHKNIGFEFPKKIMNSTKNLCVKRLTILIRKQMDEFREKKTKIAKITHTHMK